MTDKSNGQGALERSEQAAAPAAAPPPPTTPGDPGTEAGTFETARDKAISNAMLATRIEDMPLMAQAEYLRTRIDPTRGQRIVDAMRLLEPFTYDSENEHNHYKYASAAKVYGVVQKVLAKAGLHVRAKIHDMAISETDLPAARSRQSNAKSALTVRLEASFAFAAPDDGPDAVLAWERRIYWGPVRDIQSQQALWTYFHRYWLTDTLLLSSFEANLEIDARGDTGIDPGGVSQAERAHRSSRYPDDRFQGPPPPGEHIDEAIDYDGIIERGREKNEMSAEDLEQLFRECGDDKGKVITALSDRYKKTIERREAEKKDAVSLAGEEHPKPTDAPAAAAQDPGHPAARAQARAEGEGTAQPAQPAQPAAATAPAAAATTAAAASPASAAASPASAASGSPAGSGQRLSENEIRPVYEKIVKAGIDEGTMRRIVSDYLHAGALKDVTAEQVFAARDAARLRLPEGTGVSDTLWAVIRDASLRIEDQQHADGDDAPPPEPPPPGDGDNGHHGHETSELDPSPHDAAPAGAAAPPEPPPTLTVEEEIQRAITKHGLTESDIKTLRAMAKGDNNKLLKLVKNIVKSLGSDS